MPSTLHRLIASATAVFAVSALWACDEGDTSDVADLGTGTDTETPPDTATTPDSDAAVPDTDAALPDTDAVVPDADAAEPDADAVEPDADTGDSGDADTSDTGEPDTDPTDCPGGTGCPCDGPGACDSGACAWAADGTRVCAARCADGPDSAACVGSAVCGQVDGVAACVTPGLTLCQPCDEDAHCTFGGDAGARCVTRADGAFCAIPCDRGCPDGYACTTANAQGAGEVSVCLPAGGAACACTGFGVAVGAATACLVSGSEDCAAARVCALDAGSPTLLACGPADLTQEVCDGVDDDCDGLVDEGCDVDDDGFCAPSAAILDGATCEPGDCDDGDDTVHPGASELAGDGFDTDCDSRELCYVDADLDGARSAATAHSEDLGCTTAGFAPATAPLDCDDADDDVFPGGPEADGDGVDSDCDGQEVCFIDADKDGARTDATAIASDVSCTTSSGLALEAAALDCDDDQAERHPGATEVAGDGIDADCDGRELCFVDADKDGARTIATTLAVGLTCAQADGLAAAGAAIDCDDDAPDIHPGASDPIGTGVDHNCDGVFRCYVDSDGDGARLTTSVVDASVSCAAAHQTALLAALVDCNDDSSDIHPGATEVADDGIDSDCDQRESCFVDADRDGFRTEATSLSATLTCPRESGLAGPGAALDCNDANASVHPDSAELVGDGIDQDCNGVELCHVDADHDGYRVAHTAVSQGVTCLATDGLALAAAALDCDDAIADIHPGAEELPGDLRDSDCDQRELCFIDGDGDGVRGPTSVETDDLVCSASGHFPASAPLDCDDDDDTIHPGAIDLPGDGVDSDCLPDGYCFVDADLDGARTEVIVAVPGADGCVAADGFAPSSAPIDCDDADDQRHPAATELAGDGIDQNCDGDELCYVDADKDGARSTSIVTAPGTSCATLLGLALATAPVDCADTDPTIHPTATELAGDGVDQDCDGRELCYRDADGDGARTGEPALSVDLSCAAAAHLALTAAPTDCNDGDAAVHPAAAELAGDGVDQNCDGRELCHVDADQDGARIAATVEVIGTACISTLGHALASASIDCADGDAAIHPTAVEQPGDGIDQNCDGRELCFVDVDQDGARSALTALASALVCARSDGFASASAASDCNDADAAIHPAATELAGDGVDSDCDTRELCYVDQDGDGFRTDTTALSLDTTCVASAGLALASTQLDCDDAAADVHAGATETSDDGVDSNCDGFELFDNNLLAVTGTMGRGPYAVTIAGPFVMPWFGNPAGLVQVTGTAERAALGAPVTWCVAANATHDFGAFSFSGVATVCRTLAGSSPTVALTGTALGDDLSWAVTGEVSRAAPFDLALTPSGSVVVRGDAFAVVSDVARSRFEVTTGVPSWRAEATRAAVTLDPAIIARDVTLTFQHGTVAFSGTIGLSHGLLEATFNATGIYGMAGPYTLNVQSAPGSSFLIFTPNELALGLRALGTAGVIQGDGSGGAIADLTASSFCSGDCCDPHPYGGCEVPAMRACAGTIEPICGTAWTAACVAALDQCPLKIADFLTLEDPTLRVSAGGGNSYEPIIYGSPTLTGFDALDVPPMTMRTVRHSCRDSTTRYCAWTHDATCTLDTWSTQCDDVVVAECGGAAALTRCGVGEVFASAAFPGMWRPGGEALHTRFGLRDAWLDLFWRRLPAQPGETQNPRDPANWTVEGSLRADGMVCLSGECDATWWTSAPSGSTTPDEGARVFPMRGLFTQDIKYLIGEVADLHLPVFESPAGAAIVFSTTPLPLDGGGSFDVMDTPNEPADDIALREGLSFVAFGPASIPIPIEQIESSFPVPMWAVMANLEGLSLSLEAQANFNWTFIPEGVVPTIRALKYQGVRAYATIGLGSVVKYLFSAGAGTISNFFGKERGAAKDVQITFGVEAGAELWTTNQEEPLVGKVNLEFKPDKAGGIIGGNAYLAGKWIEPFGLVDFGVQTLGLTLYLNIETGYPISLGFSRNIYWRPPGCEWPPESQDWVLDHGCLTAFEVGFFYEPWTDVMLNGELANISLNTAGGILNSMAQTAVNTVNFALAEVQDPTLVWTKIFKDLAWDSALLGDLIDTVQIPALPALPQIPEIPGFDITLETARIYYAPKPNYRWGQYYPPGGAIEGRININDQWRGHVLAELENLAFIPKALHLYGDIDPIIIGPLQLTGDPYARSVTLNGGHIAIPHHSSLLPVPVTDALGTSVQATVEAWVKKAAWAESESAVLYDKSDGANGLTVRVARLGPSEVPMTSTQYLDIPGEEGDDIEFETTGTDPGADRAWIVVEVKNDGETRTYRTERGVLPASDEWQHIAVAVRGLEAVAIVNAEPLTLTAEGAAVEIGSTIAPAVAGVGFDALDELRLWRHFRQPVDINWDRKNLGVAMAQSPDLLLRYTFDWDAAAGPLHNSRNVGVTEGSPVRELDATLVGGAVTEARLDTDIAWRLDLAWLALPPTASMSMQAGAAIPIPLLPEPLTFRVWSHYDTVSLMTTAEVYARRQQVLATPWGGLRIDGDGPNLLRGDFDDGLYGSMEARTSSIGIAATARLDWLPPEGEATTVGEADVYIGCPQGQSCASFDEHVFTAAGTIDLTMQLAPLPAVRLYGEVDIDSVAQSFDLAGAINVGGMEMASGAIHVDAERITFTTGLTLPELFGENLLSTEATLELVYAPFSLCGRGFIDGPGIIDCDADLCVTFPNGSPTIEIRSLQCFGLCWHDGMCEENQFCDLLGECHGKKPNDMECAGLLVGDHECLSGFCDIWKAFPVPVCADPLPDWVGCIDDGQCISGHCGNQRTTGRKMCYTPQSKILEDECADDAACIMGGCWGTLTWNPRCLCYDNAHCAQSPNITPGHVCKTGDWGITPLAGFCIPPRQVGEACDAVSECQAGLHCGSGVCYVPYTQTNWGACLGPTHCQTGTCYLGACRCSTHEECRADSSFGATAYCDQGTWLAGNNEGKCHPAKSADGGYCEDAAWCQSGYCDQSNICVTPASKHNWEACSVPIECITGSCFGGQCRCANHAECVADPSFGAQAYCDMGAWAVGNQEGRCFATKSADGAYCEDTTWCQSGNCAGNRCYTPRTKHNWEECVSGDECISGGCYLGQCRCAEHTECAADPAFGATAYCDRGVWAAGNQEGRCYAAKKPDGNYCEDASWCLSGYCDPSGICVTPASKHNWEACSVSVECVSGGCFAGQCRCANHTECTADPAFGPASFCNMGDWIPGNEEGRCQATKRADGNYCEDAAWCLSGTCISGICVTPSSKHNWQACTFSQECISGSCFAGQCRCTNHNDCAADPAFGPASFCNMGDWFPGNEEGRCNVPRHADGNYCEDASWCLSGTCISGICVTPSSKHNWEACTFPQECISGTCFEGQCRCSTDGECAADPAFGPNSYCNQGPWFTGNVEGRCHVPKVGFGEFCESDAWCSTGACAPNMQCYARHVRHNWEPCMWGDECISGACFAGQCRCNDHGDCQADPNFSAGYCDMGPWSPGNGEGKCYDHKSGWDAYCEDGNWCQSGNCQYVFPVGNRCR